MTLPVLIIGAGPVGMTLASELARYGVNLRIVDKAMHRTDKSKAIIVWSRTLEMLDRGGYDGALPFVNAGFKMTGMSFVANDEVVGRVAIDGIDSIYPYALTIPQSETERLLEERLAAQGVRIERGTEAKAFETDADGVRSTLQGADRPEESVRSQWLVGCDGAHSSVRHLLGLPFAGETLLSDWFLADIHMTGYPRAETDGTIYWHKDGVLLLIPMGHGRFRIIGDLPYSEAAVPSPPTVAQVQAIVDRRGPAGIKLFDPVWLSGFRINGRKVAQYRQGRVFVAGDAAHIHSPAGGQGMNTGMQDAFNLAWKLAMAIRKDGPESLLDSFSPERSYVGDEVLKAAARLTAVATLKNPVAQRLRNFAGHLALGLPLITHGVADTMSETAIRYPRSPLNGPRAGHGPQPGERVPPVVGETPIGAGTAPRFVLLAKKTAAVSGLTERFGNLIGADIRAPLQEGFVFLVRPDGYLACSSAASNLDVIANYLDRVVGQTNAIA